MKASCTFSVGDISGRIDDRIFQQPKHSWGFANFVPHSRLNRNDLLDQDGTLTLEANIKLIGEQVNSDNKNVTDYNMDLMKEISNLKGLLTSDYQNNMFLKKEVSDIKKVMRYINDKMSELKILVDENSKVLKEEVNNYQELKGKVIKLDSNINQLTASVENVQVQVSSGKEVCPKSECPVCLDILKPPKRLMQCRQGHIICDDCFKSSEKSLTH